MSKNRPRLNLNDKFFAIYLLITIPIFILFNFNPHARTGLFLIFKPFIHGVSNFKMNFFILYSLVLCLALWIKKGIRSPRLITLFKNINFISVISSAILGLFTFLSLAHKLKIPLDKYSYHFKGHYVTINYFAHNHTTKLPLYYLTKLLHLDRLNEICDTALPLAEYVNPFLLCALAFFTSLALFCFISLVCDVITKWDKHRQWLVFILYAFASGHVLKCLIDGGMFSYDLLPSVIAIHLLFYAHDPESLSALFKKNVLRYLFIFLSSMIIGSAFSGNEALLQTPIGSLFFICIFVLLFLMLSVETAASRDVLSTTHNPSAIKSPCPQADKPMRRRIKLASKVSLSIFCCLYIVFYFNIHATTDIYALMRKVQKNDRILHYSYRPDNPQKGLPLVSDQSLEMLNKKFVDVYSELGENPFRNRNTAIIRPEDSRAYGFIFALKILKSGEEVNLTPNDFVKIQILQNLSKVSENAFLLKVTFNKALFPSLWEMKPSIIGENNRFAAYFFLNHYFLSCGIKEYIMIPYYFQILP